MFFCLKFACVCLVLGCLVTWKNYQMNRIMMMMRKQQQQKKVEANNKKLKRVGWNLNNGKGNQTHIIE